MSPIEAVRSFIAESTRFVSPPAIAAEWVLFAAAALLIVIAPFGRLRLVRRWFHRLAAHKRASVVLCGVLPVVVRLALLGSLPVPLPSIHDEFSHLLLGDTLAHGRLTNPTHPLWKHFESIHIIQQPTYNSMYPPAQGSFLALGEAVFHEPWAGVVISVGLMFAAMCWMMQGWLPPSWALFGTLVAIAKFGITGFWMNSYMGGSAPALGGALLVGALPRLREPRGRALHAVLLGLGMVILMNSRPFDGAVLSGAVLLYLAWEVRKRRHVFRRIVLPAAAVLLSGILFTGYYSWRVTGNPLRMPYQVNRDTYGWPENLGFLAPKKVNLRHQSMRDMYLKEIHHRDIYENAGDFADNLTTRLFDNWTYFIGPVLSMSLLFGFRGLRRGKTRPLVFFLAIILGLNLLQMLLYPYHLAPVVPILFTLVAQGSRYIYVAFARFNRKRAVRFALLLPVCVIAVSAMKEEAPELSLPLAYWENGYEPHRDARAFAEAWLAQRPAKQLVIVRYAPWHPPNQEWVYNHADIDGSKVVWAREMDAASNDELIQYFSDREAWLLQADVYPQRVVPYPLPD